LPLCPSLNSFSDVAKNFLAPRSGEPSLVTIWKHSVYRKPQETRQQKLLRALEKQIQQLPSSKNERQDGDPARVFGTAARLPEFCGTFCQFSYTSVSTLFLELPHIFQIDKAKLNLIFVISYKYKVKSATKPHHILLQYQIFLVV
jgi:hypothetical protein